MLMLYIIFFVIFVGIFSKICTKKKCNTLTWILNVFNFIVFAFFALKYSVLNGT